MKQQRLKNGLRDATSSALTLSQRMLEAGTQRIVNGLVAIPGRRAEAYLLLLLKICLPLRFTAATPE